MSNAEYMHADDTVITAYRTYLTNHCAFHSFMQVDWKSADIADGLLREE